MPRTGSCLCGAVKYTLTADLSTAGACHCGMCRKWTGGINIALMVAPDQITFEGAENIAPYRSSDWAERCFCRICGSSLYYRVVAPGPHHGTLHIGMGGLDDPAGVTVTQEIFTDRKPAGYDLAGDLDGMTEAEVMEMFAQS